MLEAFITAFIIYFVVIDPVGNAPIFLAVTEAQDRARKLRTALEGTAIATAIMLFFALCGAWILAYLNITEAAFKIAGGIILFLVALDMLAAKRQQRKRAESTGGSNTGETSAGETSEGETGAEEPDSDNLAIYPLAIPLLAGPSAIMSVIVVNAGFAGALASTLTGYAALLAVMVATGVILCLTVIAEGWLNERITMVFSRITAIILAGLSVQYVIDGLTAIGIVNSVNG
ncbi:MAG: MarC family protein [Candidatus Puniceispirillaceae bacterium]